MTRGTLSMMGASEMSVSSVESSEPDASTVMGGSSTGT